MAFNIWWQPVNYFIACVDAGWSVINNICVIIIYTMELAEGEREEIKDETHDLEDTEQDEEDEIDEEEELEEEQ